MDMMHLLSLLHSKTTFYREVDIDKNKEIYENIINNINYLNDYYNELISLIEKEVYMSPSSYLIARNINIIFSSIYYVRDNIEKWYKKIENNKNERVSYIHNNINLDHYFKRDKPYLISWNKSRIDNPIYDLLSFYKNHYLEFDFDDLFHYYESNYPLKEDERLLLFTYMAIPPVMDKSGSEYDMCIKINKTIDYLYKTSNLIMNYQKQVVLFLCKVVIKYFYFNIQCKQESDYMRCVDTVIHGIRTGVIKSGDNLEDIVVNSVLKN